MATLRELKGRIGSVKSSEKITGAMKMISSAKMHKAEQGLRRLMPFRTQLQAILGNLLTTDATFSSPLIDAREVKRIGIVVFGSDDGLCGAYNLNIFKALLLQLHALRGLYGQHVAFTLYPVGAKMLKACSKLQDPNVKISPKPVSAKATSDIVKEFSFTLQKHFTDGEIDRLDIVYMQYRSVSKQVLEASQMLPVTPTALLDEGVKGSCRPCLFEPGPNAIFNSVLPLYQLSLMQEVFTQNLASEQAARVMAMQSANDNAKKLLESLQLEYNKLRQQAITNELLDILGGQVR